MASDLKKLQKEETYLKAISDIKEAEAQAVKDAERAALNKKADKKGASSSNKVEEEKPAGKAEKADAAIVSEIDLLFAVAGKDAAASKEKAVSRMQACASSTPFMLSRIDKLTPLFDNAKLAGPAAKAAKAIIESTEPKGHGIAAVVVPILLAGMNDKKWKVKAGCIELLVPCLQQMENTPQQMALALPLIVPRLAEAALEVRAEIRNATGAVLREIGSGVASPEIKKLSQDLVPALVEPTNQKHTQSVLEKMGSQTFLSLIDPASLSLLMPVIVRGLKERDSMSKKWSAQIFGATSMLVQDTDCMLPYLTAVVPLLQSGLSNPVPEVQRECAKAFGTIEQCLPDYSRQHSQPWLFGMLRNGEIGEQLGASLALAEVLLKMDKSLMAKLVPEIELAAGDEKTTVRRGFLELLEVLPHAMKMEFVPYITRLFPKMLMGITGDADKDADAGLKAATSLVARFGDLCPQLLLSGFETVYCATVEAATSEEQARNLVIRDRSAMLLGKLADKILEHKKFGQDLLNTEDCSNKETREWVLVMVFLMRFDSDASVKRWANGAWKTSGGAPKLQKAILPCVEKMLARMRGGEMGLGMQKLASKMVEELTKAGDMEAPTADEAKDVSPFTFAPAADRDASSAEARIAAGNPPDVEETARGRLASTLSEKGDLFASHAAFASIPADVVHHCSIVATSVITEGKKQRHSGQQMVAAIVKQLDVVLKHLSEDGSCASAELPAVAEAAVRAVLGDAFDAKGGSGG